MAFSMDLKINRSIVVSASSDAAWKLVTDTLAQQNLFPKVDKINDMGHDVYQWRFKELGGAGMTMSIVYASKYHKNPDELKISWTPAPGDYNSRFSGYWKIEPTGDTLRMYFELAGTIDLPFSALMKGVIKPFVSGAFERYCDYYMENIIKELEGR